MRRAKTKFFVPKDSIQFADFKKFENISLILTKFCPFLVEIDGELKKPRYDRFGRHIKLSEEAFEIYNEYLRRIEALLLSINFQTKSEIPPRNRFRRRKHLRNVN